MDAESSGLVRLTRADIEPAARMLGRAFRDYPLVVHAVPDAATRERAAVYFSMYDLYYGMRYGEAYATSPRMEGVVVWVNSDRLPMTFRRMLSTVPWSVTVHFGLRAWRRLLGPSRHIDERRAAVAPYRHWFLSIIGVAPEFQGQGFAGVLLRPRLAAIEAEGLSCYLETMSERNVFRYQHFGFRVVDRSSVPGTQLTSWAMLRGDPPRTDD